MTGVEMDRRKQTTAVLALLMGLVLLMGCEADSPTAPAPGGGGGGGTAPPQGANIALSVSNANPLVNSTATITATVTQDGSPVPNGTAVEFSTNLGTFVDTAANTTIKTTTGGAASATLTSAQIGPATVTVRVSNVTATTTVTFREQDPPTPGQPVPSITSIQPNQAPPTGGQVVSIRGSNFEGPVRVLFGEQQATVVSVTSTEIRVIVPPITLGLSEQAREVQVIVINEAGTQDEITLTAPQPFRYQLEVLTPVIHHVSPSEGPNEGNTRISIFGEGFQSPVKVFFGTGGSAGGNLTDSVEVEVLQASFGQIIAMTPPATGLAASFANTQVTMRVLNVASNTDAVQERAFRYGPAIQITSITPTQGTAEGGTRVTIFGWGFDDPVAVTIAGIPAQPIRVSGTEITAITGATASPCVVPAPGPVTVKNIEEITAEASGGTFTYRTVPPEIISVSPTEVDPGEAVSVTVRDPGAGTVRFTIGDRTVQPTSATVVDGAVTYTIIVPSDLTFAEEPCENGLGVRFVPLRLSITFTNVTTGCPPDTLTDAISVIPEDTSCRIPPTPAINPASLDFGSVTEGGTANLEVTVSNAGGGNLRVLSASTTDPRFTVTGSTFPDTLEGGDSQSYTVRFSPPVVGVPTEYTGTITFNTDAGNVSVSVSGTGTPPPP